MRSLMLWGFKWCQFIHKLSFMIFTYYRNGLCTVTFLDDMYEIKTYII